VLFIRPTSSSLI